MENIITFKITGISPILMNNPESMNYNKETSTRTKAYNDEHEAKIREYRNIDGSLFIPSIAFLNSLWQGASYQKIGKDSARSRITSAVFITDPETLLLNKDTGNPITEYKIDKRFVVVNKARIPRCRPMISNWIAYLSLEFDEDYISVDHVLPLFNKAGKTVGIMDYRPQNRGSFGRYIVELYKNK